jgi:hypothetical protein
MKYKIIDSMDPSEEVRFPYFLHNFSYSNGRYWVIENHTNIFVNFFTSHEEAEYYCDILNKVDDV